MATHNSLFRETDVHRHPDGLSVSVQLPWYRSLWLSAVDDVDRHRRRRRDPAGSAPLRAAGTQLPDR